MENLSGQTFGVLKVLEYFEKDILGYHSWKCCCKCGNIVIAAGSKLKRGIIKCCKDCVILNKHKNDLSGQNFGNLNVVSLKKEGNGYKWLCNCFCGNTYLAKLNELQSGARTSCGCMIVERGRKTKKQMIGQIFGYLTVLSESGEKEKNGQYIYNCQCKCGKIITARGRILRDGGIVSCGCLNLKSRTSSFGVKLNSYKKSTNAKKLGFHITNDQFLKLISGNCFYCGKTPQNNSIGRITKKLIPYNGIDRQDSDIGYVAGNCVSCCKECNYTKRDRTVEDFKDWIKKCHDYLFSQK